MRHGKLSVTSATVPYGVNKLGSGNFRGPNLTNIYKAYSIPIDKLARFGRAFLSWPTQQIHILTNVPCSGLLDIMAPTLVHLPNGQTITVSPVFAGLAFKANDLNIHHSVFPPGWTIILETSDDDHEEEDAQSPPDEKEQIYGSSRRKVHSYKAPSLHNDHLFISSISNPSNTDFKPATSPTRQIAMMLWATLWWYFHQVSLPVFCGRISD